MSLFRYSGSKSKRTIRTHILNRIAAIWENETEYCEPFLGGAGILEHLLTDRRFNFTTVRLNDRDPGISAVWTAIIHYPERLKDKLRTYQPRVEDFYAFKDELLILTDYIGQTERMVEIAFKKIALHRISYHGLGTMAGGPYGGRAQRSKNKVGDRYNPVRLARQIDQLHERLSQVEVIGQCCWCEDFAFALRDANGHQFWYVDAPYWQWGNRLYQCGFTIRDHETLAATLRSNGIKFILSYDDVPEIWDLYQWANIERLTDTVYSIKGAKRPSELLISR
jgi:DNA adenine methylase